MKTITVTPHGLAPDPRIHGPISVAVEDRHAEAVLSMLTVACEEFADVGISGWNEAVEAAAQACERFAKGGSGAGDVARRHCVSLVRELAERGEPEASFIAGVEPSFNSGGGCMVDFVLLRDGRCIGITDECAVLYPSREAFNEPPEEVQHYQHLDLLPTEDRPTEEERHGKGYAP